MVTDYVYSYLPQGVRVGAEGGNADDLFVMDRERRDRDIPPLASQAGSDSGVGGVRLVHRPQQLLTPDLDSVLCPVRVAATVSAAYRLVTFISEVVR